MKYFAYGSNMLVQRLRSHDRAPSAKFLTIGKLPGHVLKFHKRSKDSSGKCNALETGNPLDEVYGVVFDIDEADKPDLDRAEGRGKGYEEKMVHLNSPNGSQSTHTYLADADYIDDSLLPYSWYKDLVVAGAKQHSLPPEYIRQLQAVEAQEDPDSERANRERQILL